MRIFPFQIDCVLLLRHLYCATGKPHHGEQGCTGPNGLLEGWYSPLYFGLDIDPILFSQHRVPLCSPLAGSAPLCMFVMVMECHVKC